MDEWTDGKKNEVTFGLFHLSFPCMNSLHEAVIFKHGDFIHSGR